MTSSLLVQYMSSDSEKDDARSVADDGVELTSRDDMLGIFMQRELRPSSQEPILGTTVSSYQTGSLNHHPVAAASTSHNQEFSKPSFTMQK